MILIMKIILTFHKKEYIVTHQKRWVGRNMETYAASLLLFR